MNVKLPVFVGTVLSALFQALAFERTFENPKDLSVTIPDSPELRFADGLDATIRFSCNFDRLENREGTYCNLFTKGDSHTDGYSAMIRWDGRLMFYRKGGDPAYWAGDEGLQSGVESVVRIVETKTAVRIFVNGRERQSFAVRTPRDRAGNAKPLRIGGTPKNPFYGTISQLRIVSANAAMLPPLTYRPATQQPRAEILWVKPICVEDDRYIGWPTVCRLKNGELLAVFSGDRDSHICPWGKVQLVRSKDDGETWSAPQTIANGPLDDRDAGIVQMPDGEIVVTYFTSVAYREKGILAKHPEYARHDAKIAPRLPKDALGYFRIVSRDGGRTWSEPQRMTVSHAPHGPTLLRDGSLFMVGRTFVKKDVQGKHDKSERTIIRAERSCDHGATWDVLCEEIADTDGENGVPHMFHEPHVAELADGTLLAMVRYHGAKGPLAQAGNGYMRQMRSADGGKTWTPMTDSGILGMPPHLLVLPDGKVVCVYGRRLADPGFGEFAVISEDGGRTWDTKNEIVLAHSHCGDLGYPASTLLPNGDIVTVYYQQAEIGKKPCLMATKWRVTR